MLSWTSPLVAENGPSKLNLPVDPITANPTIGPTQGPMLVLFNVKRRTVVEHEDRLPTGPSSIRSIFTRLCPRSRMSSASEIKAARVLRHVHIFVLLFGAPFAPARAARQRARPALPSSRRTYVLAARGRPGFKVFAAATFRLHRGHPVTWMAANSSKDEVCSSWRGCSVARHGPGGAVRECAGKLGGGHHDRRDEPSVDELDGASVMLRKAGPAETCGQHDAKA